MPQAGRVVYVAQPSQWTNFYIPGIIALVLASMIPSLTSEWIAAWLGWIIAVVAFSVLFWVFVWVVGFVVGLFGARPFDMTLQFGNGWDRRRNIYDRVRSR